MCIALGIATVVVVFVGCCIWAVRTAKKDDGTETLGHDD